MPLNTNSHHNSPLQDFLSQVAKDQGCIFFRHKGLLYEGIVTRSFRKCFKQGIWVESTP